MKKLILLFLSVQWLSNLRAQTSIIPVGGVVLSGYRITGTRYPEQSKMRFGPCFGALVGFPLGNGKLSLQSGILYKLNGYSPIAEHQAPDEFARVRIGTIDMPIKAVCSFPANNRSKLFVGLGAYVAINIAASVHYHYYQRDFIGNPIRLLDSVESVKLGGENNIARVDAGGGVNFGYIAGSGLLISVHGQYGLVNLGNALTIMHNYNFGIVAGYTFKLSKKAHSTDDVKKSEGSPK